MTVTDQVMKVRGCVDLVARECESCEVGDEGVCEGRRTRRQTESSQVVAMETEILLKKVQIFVKTLKNVPIPLHWKDRCSSKL